MTKIPKADVKKINAKTTTGENVVLTFKKHKNSNEYLKVGDYWVRNFYGESLKAKDVNNFYYNVDIKYIIDNEMKNSNMRHPYLEMELFRKYKRTIIFSDGYDFEKNHKLFDRISPDVLCIAVNQAARFWNAASFPDFLLINNPDEVCLTGMPVSKFPALIASRKTCNRFLQNYKNIIYIYDSVSDEYYESQVSKNSEFHLDDYRNPICAAISLASKFVRGDIYLAFCSTAYKEKRDGMSEIDQGIYQYGPQSLADKMVDGNLFWYRIGNGSSKIFHTGVKNSFKFSTYIDTTEMCGLVK